MTLDPFADIVDALSTTDDTLNHPVRFDGRRKTRTGIHEFILGGSKSEDDIILAIVSSLATTGRALATRITPDIAHNIVRKFAFPNVAVYDNASSILRVRTDSYVALTNGGRLGIVAAGTSDRPAAAGVAVIAEEMGCEVRQVTDVGVAGLHRLVAPLRALMDWDPDVIVAVAGMDGALPSVLAGLVPVPVIGLPTSTGYGMGGDGTAALLSMLQSCAPGLAVVNIDNAVGAATTAGLIAIRAAQSRVGERT